MAPTTAPNVNVPAPSEAPDAPKKRAVRYPAKLYLSITLAMSDSLQRLSDGPNSLANAGQWGRLALHQFLIANNPVYARTMGNGHGG